jgi:hypothetical protein
MLHLRSGVGVIELGVWLGQDPTDQHWGCPIRERWGLTAHQQLSPALQEKLAFTTTATGSYAEAAAVAAKWGSPVEDSTVQALVQRQGAHAETQIQARLSQPPAEVVPQRAAAELGVLMVDGWLVRQRGPGWGCKKTKQARVEWHELKTGVFYRHEQAAQTAGGRGLLTETVVVSWQGEALELGRRLHWEALRGGLGRARDTLVVADGGPRGFGTSWRIGGAGRRRYWTFTMPANTSGNWGAPWGVVRKQWRRGWNHACIGCGTGRSAPSWRRSRRWRCRAGRGVKSCDANRATGPGTRSGCTTPRYRRAAGRSVAERWSRPVGNGNVGSSGRGNSGRRRACGICAPWKKPAATAIGMNSG